MANKDLIIHFSHGYSPSKQDERFKNADNQTLKNVLTQIYVHPMSLASAIGESRDRGWLGGNNQMVVSVLVYVLLSVKQSPLDIRHDGG